MGKKNNGKQIATSMDRCLLHSVDLIQESKINISITKHGMFDLKVLNAGNYDKEKGSDGFELLANSVDFLTAAGGMWVGIKGVS